MRDPGRQSGEAEMKGVVSPADYFEWSARARALPGFAAWRGQSVNVSGAGAPPRTSGVLVTPSYFELFGWEAAMGRTFAADDAVPGAPRVVVLSQAYWENHLSRRADVLGQTLTLDGERTTVVGVLPRLPGVTAFFVPLVLDNARSDRSARTLFVMARLEDGATLESARVEMLGVGQTLEREFPTTNRGWEVNTRPLQEEFVGPQARLVCARLAGTVLTVLLIGCVNIANLLLARGAARRGELAVRLALGAGGWRVVRQLLVECALLAALGGLLSLAISRWTINILMTLGPIDSPWVANGGLNLRVLLLTAAASFLATAIAGLVPALAARHGDVVSSLRATGRSGAAATRRTTRALVAAQVALAVTLLIMAGLITRTLIAIERLEAGFDMNNLLTVSVTRPEVAPAEQAAGWSPSSTRRWRGGSGPTDARWARVFDSRTIRKGSGAP